MESIASSYRPISASLDHYYLRRPRLALALILIGYVVAATLYAVITPDWQNPDEPAHYNNIAYIAAGHGLPVLHAGDYDQEYLNALVSGGFPPHLSIASLRYEAYQPPLYYIAATPAFWLGNGNLLFVRLFNVFLGAVSLLLLYACMETVFPTKPLLTVGATAFVAFLPMHVAMSAAINNDGLAELLMLATMLTLLRWLKRRFYRSVAFSSSRTDSFERRTLLLLGVLLGLSMATKIYGYAAAPLVAGVVLLTVWLAPAAQLDQRLARPTRQNWRRALGAALWVLTPALLLTLPLWLRNLQLYGAWDLLGLQMHDRLVAGQPTTAAWIAQEGFVTYLERTMDFTFRSFWGVFGWLGVFMEPRIYTLLLAFTGVLMLGLLWALVRFICGRPEADMDRYQFWVLGLFGVMVLAVFASFIWYNLKFVQHQGRYLFWGLLPISAFVALAWRELMQPLQGKLTGLMAVVLAAALAVADLRTDIMDRRAIVAIGLFGLLLMVQPLLLIGSVDAIVIGAPPWLHRLFTPRRLQPLLGVMRVVVWASPFLALFALNLLIPFWYIAPQLGD
jgi:4-amino-4-deoxy-L-arabinose transferase-like glycosyltransferase